MSSRVDRSKSLNSIIAATDAVGPAGTRAVFSVRTLFWFCANIACPAKSTSTAKSEMLRGIVSSSFLQLWQPQDLTPVRVARLQKYRQTAEARTERKRREGPDRCVE